MPLGVVHIGTLRSILLPINASSAGISTFPLLALYASTASFINLWSISSNLSLSNWINSAFFFLATSSKQIIFTCNLSAIGSSPGIVQLNSETTISTAPVAKTALGALCGSCGLEMTGNAYLTQTACPRCQHAFNPQCHLHQQIYFC